MFKLEKIKIGIYLLTFNDHIDLVSHFMRFQEIYESPNDNFYRQPFQLLDYQRWYLKNGRKNNNQNIFTYYNDWSGFNLTTETIINYYPLLEDKNSHDHFMMQIAEYIVRDHGSKNCYLIGAKSLEINTIKHEIAHGLYYTDNNYHDEIESIVRSFDLEQLHAMHAHLKKLGYRTSVFMDETQAFLAGGNTEDILDKKYLKQVVSVFNEYTKDVNFDKIGK